LRAFIEQKGPAVFVSTDAGGVGLNLQVADVVINLDLPWNPARLEQRIARVHRIGSKRAVQELIFVTKDSIEERILRLHDTKRDVLANIWDKGDRDTIAAPGGSGAFREMIASLLRVGSAQVPAAESTPEPSADSPLDLVATPEGAAAESSDFAEVTSADPASVSSTPAAAAGSEVRSTTSIAVDPAALLAAVSAIAPAMPPDHRKSLAAVLRVLAEGLESA
jgi:superfamily II DNA/RNA helicase